MIPKIKVRVRQLLLLLSSNRDGEVVAAARALCRTLRGAGADLHDLADVLDGNVMPSPPPPPPPQEHPIDQRLAQHILENHESELTDWEIEFLKSIVQWRGRLTAKQHARLEKLWREIRGRA
jgi:hypothetical protein